VTTIRPPDPVPGRAGSGHPRTRALPAAAASAPPAASAADPSRAAPGHRPRPAPPRSPPAAGPPDARRRGAASGRRRGRFRAPWGVVRDALARASEVAPRRLPLVPSLHPPAAPARLAVRPREQVERRLAPVGAGVASTTSTTSTTSSAWKSAVTVPAVRAAAHDRVRHRLPIATGACAVAPGARRREAPVGVAPSRAVAAAVGVGPSAAGPGAGDARRGGGSGAAARGAVPAEGAVNAYHATPAARASSSVAVGAGARGRSRASKAAAAGATRSNAVSRPQAHRRGAAGTRSDARTSGTARRPPGQGRRPSRFSSS
jgi:hypothetical protein